MDLVVMDYNDSCVYTYEYTGINDSEEIEGFMERYEAKSGRGGS